MSAFELSVIVTAHDETVVSGPTMRSADAAIEAAETRGISVERIIALDAATEDCREFFSQPDFDHWARLQLKQRDLGRTRNEVVQKCSGAYIAFLDCDDLFSENWLVEGVAILRDAARAGERMIVHPELNWIFDSEISVLEIPNQEDELFSPYYLYFSNYYDSLCLSPREAHLEIPYVHRDIPNGLSFQDWQFGIETMAANWKHVVAKDTIIFKRRRDSSLVRESSDRQAILRELEPMAIDRVMDLGRK